MLVPHEIVIGNGEAFPTEIKADAVPHQINWRVWESGAKHSVDNREKTGWN